MKRWDSSSERSVYGCELIFPRAAATEDLQAFSNQFADWWHKESKREDYRLEVDERDFDDLCNGELPKPRALKYFADERKIRAVLGILAPNLPPLTRADFGRHLEQMDDSDSDRFMSLKFCGPVHLQPQPIVDRLLAAVSAELLEDVRLERYE